MQLIGEILLFHSNIFYKFILHCSDDSLGYDFPFTCRAVTGDGLNCALCPWSNFCRGCEIPCNDNYLLQGMLMQSSSSGFFFSFFLENLQSNFTGNSSTPKMQPRFSSLPNLNTNFENGFKGGLHIAIDWDPTALHLRYQVTRERVSLYKMIYHMDQ